MILDKARIDHNTVDSIILRNGLPEGLIEAACTLRDESRDRELRFYYPKPSFPSVSITGSRCSLQCKHCNAHFLTGMANVDTPKKLMDFCMRHEMEGGVGVLISGGSTPNGRVPLEKFYDAMTWVKENTSLILNVHTGLLSPDEAEGIASTGADIVSVDVVGSNDTIRKVYGLNATVKDYQETLASLKNAGVSHIIPHICVGLDFGKLRGEGRALLMLEDIDPEIIVVIALIPTKQTFMERVEPPSVNDVVKVVAVARLLFPSSNIALGCMRPRVEKSFEEELVIKAGASGIVLPTKATVDYARLEGYKIVEIKGCCAIPKSLEHKAIKTI